MSFKLYLKSCYYYEMLEQYLIKNAQNGEFIIDIKGPILKFKKVDPVTGTFKFIIKERLLKPDEELKQSYIEIAKKENWSYEFESNSFYVFFKEEENAIFPIEADEKKDFETMKRLYIETEIFLIIVTFQAFFVHRSLLELIENDYLIKSVIYYCILIGLFTHTSAGLKWLYGNGYRAKNNLPIEYPTKEYNDLRNKLRLIWTPVFAVLSLILVIAVIV